MSAAIQFGPFKDETQDSTLENLREILDLLSGPADCIEKGLGSGQSQGSGQVSDQENIEIEISDDAHQSLLKVSMNIFHLLCPLPDTMGTKSNITGIKGNLNTILLSYLSYNQMSHPPLSISSIKAKEISCLFLSEHVFDLLPMAPVGNLDLIDRLFQLYFLPNLISKDYIIEHQHENKDENKNKNKDMNKTKVETDVMIRLKEKITWEELVIFCSICCVWGIKHSILAASMITKFRISLTELRAIRSDFTLFDFHMNGNILASDLQGLLSVS